MIEVAPWFRSLSITMESASDVNSRAAGILVHQTITEIGRQRISLNQDIEMYLLMMQIFICMTMTQSQRRRYKTMMTYKRLLNLLPLIIIITFSESCNQKQNNSTQVLKKDTCNCTADTIICNLKYSLYLHYADNQFSFNDDSTSQHFFSECELILDTLKDDNRELLCRVTFSYGSRQLTKANLKPSGNRLFVKIIYDKFKNKIVGYGTGDNVFFYVKSPQSDRLVNPLQPEVVKFLKANETILNCWFKSELLKKGIL